MSYPLTRPVALFSDPASDGTLFTTAPPDGGRDPLV